MPTVPRKLAARVGQVVAFGFIALGIFRFFGGAGIGGLWIAFIGWFLLQAARESYVQVGLAHALKGVRVARCDDAGLPHRGWLVECPELRGAGAAAHRAALFLRGG